MAGIKELRIMGVRSFGPDGKDSQKVKFDKPLTLILGQNGCGKTTIIECLKYAITGELPPGSNGGKSFVHHPKVNKSREVPGKVMLRVMDSQGQDVIVSRNMQVTATVKNMTFKTLDTSISRLNPETGQTVEINSKCSETDEIMCASLGVSKAILSNVIFCHQEDSNWPLDEGKKLKEKFDAIFDATKYNKCYENIRKLLKKYGHDIDILVKDVDYWTEKKKELDNKRLNIAATQEKMSNFEVRLNEIRVEITPIQKRRMEIEIVEKNYLQYELEKQRAQARFETCESQMLQLQKSIKVFYKGTIDELQNDIVCFNADLERKNKELKTLKSNLDELIIKEEKCIKEISAKKIRATELTTLEGQNQERIENRNRALEDAATCAGIDLDDRIETELQAKNMQSQLLQKQKAKEKILSESKEKTIAEEKKLQTLIDQSRDAKARHIQKIVSKESELKNLNDDKKSLEMAISDANLSKYKLDKVKAELDIAESDHIRAKNEMDVESIQMKIDADESKIDRLETDISLLDNQISKLRKQSEQRLKIDNLKDTLSTKQKAFNRRKSKHMDSILDVLGLVPEENFSAKISACDSTILREIQQLNSQLENKKHQITTLETERKNQKDQISKLQNELDKAEEDIYALCRKQPLEDVLQKMDEEIEKLQEEKGELSGSRFIKKKIIEKISSSPYCPICHHCLEGNDEASEIITELNQEIEKIPSQLDSINDKLSKISEDRDRLVGMKPLNDNIKTLRDIQIPKMKEMYNKTNERLNEVKEDVENLCMVKSEPERKQNILKYLTPDMPLLDDILREIKAMEKEITKLQSQCESVGIELSLEEACEKEKNWKSQLSELRSVNKTRQMEINSHNQKFQAILDRRNKLKEEYLNIQAKVQEIFSLEDRLNQVTGTLEKTKIEVRDLNKATESLETELKLQEKNKEVLVEKMRHKLESQMDFINKLKKKYDVVIQLDSDIEAHERRNIRSELDSLKVSLEMILEEKVLTIKKKEATASKIESYKDELAKQEVNSRELSDNLQMKKCEKDLKELERSIQDIKNKLGEMNCDSLSVEKNKLIKGESSLRIEQARTEGSLNELKDSLDALKQQVKDMKNVEDKFRSKFYEYHLLKIVQKDLREYAAALDYCLMQFHKERMDKINFIIRDMWRSIYRGNDIDYVEIRTDETTTAVSSTGSSRKTYDYRVVQSRNDIEIDMRGRCSAGQKVLACLIIRMALAETFSTKFGILALDEPTTNLDRENINSLCSALSQIVQSRLQQKNFMFIIITHDIEFLTALGRVDKLNYYHEVTRNKDGKSVITKVPMK